MYKKFVPFLAISSTVLMFTSCQQQRDSSPDVLDETYVHRYGVPVSQEDWNASGNHGQIVTTLGNGVVVTKSYSAGILDGETTFSYPHSSSIEKVESYVNGILQKESSFYLSGASRQEIVYNTPQNRTSTSWYESGIPKSKEQQQGNLLFQATYYGMNNQLDSEVSNYSGTRTQRDDYGQLISIDTIDKGLITLRATYHPNNTPKELVPFVNNQVHGLVKTFYPGGEPRTIEEWKNGVQAGLTTEFLNGEKVGDCIFVDGKKQGTEHKYRDGHNIVQEITWVNGQKHGPSINFVGNITKTDWYWQGKQISKANYEIITGQGSKKSIWNKST